MTRVRVLVVDDEAAVTGYIVARLTVHGIDARGFTELPVILIAANPSLHADVGEVDNVELGIAARFRKLFVGADLRQAIANIAGCGYRG
jgi:hypothetical protein